MAKILDKPNGVLLIDATDDVESMQRILRFKQGKFFISGLEISEINSFEPLPIFTHVMFAERNIEEYLLAKPYSLNDNDATDIVGKWDLREPYNPKFISIFTPEHNKRTCMKSIYVEFQDNPPHICIEIHDYTLPNFVEYSFEIPVNPDEDKYVKAFQYVCLVARAIDSGRIPKLITKAIGLGIKVEQ